MSCANIGCASFCVVCGICHFGSFARAALSFGEVAFEVSDTPSATGTCSSAFTNLAGAARLMDADEVHDLSFRHVKAITDRIVRVHANSHRVGRCAKVARTHQFNQFLQNHGSIGKVALTHRKLASMFRRPHRTDQHILLDSWFQVDSLIAQFNRISVSLISGLMTEFSQNNLNETPPLVLTPLGRTKSGSQQGCE